MTELGVIGNYMSKLTHPLKWHGGKAYLATRIVNLMHDHIHYCEPYAGGLSVLLARDPDDKRGGVSEVVNDINNRLTNFWRVLQDESKFSDFQRRVIAIPLSRNEWDFHHNRTTFDSSVDDAVSFFVDCRQSLAGRFKNFTAITRSRTRRQMNGNVSEWLGAVDGLPAVHDRLRRVVIENMPAINLIKREDTPSTLFYCDPPYLHETRTSITDYAYEMNIDDHVELLSVLTKCKGKVMLSGYRSQLYSDALAGWRFEIFDLPNNSAGGSSKRRMIECVWMNF